MLKTILFTLIMLVTATNALAVETQIEIDRVELAGVTVFTQTDIESALEVSPGDFLDRVRVLKSAENIQALYRVHGYEQMGIKSQLERRKTESGTLEYVLQFTVREGFPTRVAEVRYVPEGFRSQTFERYWRRLSGELETKSGVLVGEIYDQEKIAGGKRGVQDLLASEEFVGASVDEVRVMTHAEPAEIRKPLPASRWVAVEFHINLGERVSFGFRGNQVFPTSKLSGFIDEQRVLGFGHDYVGAAQARIEREYRALGYAQIRITPYSFIEPGTDERHVTFTINEGPRINIDQVTFDGNAVFSNDELKETFFQKGSPLIRNRVYFENDVQRSAELTVEWMKAKGFLAAKLITINSTSSNRPKLSRTDGFVNLNIYIYEGDQTTIQKIDLRGMNAFAPEEVNSMLGVRIGSPLNLFSFSAGLEALKAAYRDRGYLSIRILNEGRDTVVQYSDENRSAAINLDVSEGPQYRVSHIQIDGLVHTNENVVRRELKFHEGDILEENKITETENNLHRLGIFAVAAVRPIDDPEQDGFKIVRVSLQEGSRIVLTEGVGIRNDLGGRVFAQASYSNLWGEDHTASLSLNTNHRIQDFHFEEYGSQLAYLWPWFAGQDVLFRPTMTFTGTQYITFDADTFTAALTWEKQLSRKLTGLLSYTLERDVQFNAQAVTDDGGYTIGTISPTLRLDLRDNPLNPSSGFFGAATFEYASPALLSLNDFPVQYLRFIFRSDYFLPLFRDATLYLSFRTGFEENFAPTTPDTRSGQIPLIKTFALGGAGSVRGYQEQELNVSNIAIKGALSYVNYRAQVDLPLAGALRFGPFLDAANLLVYQDTPTPLANSGVYSFTQDLLYGAGFGFHYSTPVGPVSFDWGYKLNPLPGTDTQQFYFSIGVI